MPLILALIAAVAIVGGAVTAPSPENLRKRIGSMLPKGGIRGAGGVVIPPGHGSAIYPSVSYAYPGGATGDPPAANFGGGNRPNFSGLQPEPTPSPGPGPGPTFVPGGETQAGPASVGMPTDPLVGPSLPVGYSAPNAGVSVAPPPPPQYAPPASASPAPFGGNSTPTREPVDNPPGPANPAGTYVVSGPLGLDFRPSNYGPPPPIAGGPVAYNPQPFTPTPPPPDWAVPAPDPGYYSSPNAGVTTPAPPGAGGGGARNL